MVQRRNRNDESDVWSEACYVVLFLLRRVLRSCTPCQEGTGWLWRIVSRIENGHGTEEDLDQLLSLADRIRGKTICALGDAAAMPVRAFVENLRTNFVPYYPQKCMVDDPQ